MGLKLNFKRFSITYFFVDYEKKESSMKSAGNFSECFLSLFVFLYIVRNQKKYLPMGLNIKFYNLEYRKFTRYIQKISLLNQ